MSIIKPYQYRTRILDHGGLLRIYARNLCVYESVLIFNDFVKPKGTECFITNIVKSIG